jgi:hypothetical protein
MFLPANIDDFQGPYFTAEVEFGDFAHLLAGHRYGDRRYKRNFLLAYICLIYADNLKFLYLVFSYYPDRNRSAKANGVFLMLVGIQDHSRVDPFLKQHEFTVQDGGSNAVLGFVFYGQAGLFFFQLLLLTKQLVHPVWSNVVGNARWKRSAWWYQGDLLLISFFHKGSAHRVSFRNYS